MWPLLFQTKGLHDRQRFVIAHNPFPMPISALPPPDHPCPHRPPTPLLSLLQQPRGPRLGGLPRGRPLPDNCFVVFTLTHRRGGGEVCQKGSAHGPGPHPPPPGEVELSNRLSSPPVSTCATSSLWPRIRPSVCYCVFKQMTVEKFSLHNTPYITHWTCGFCLSSLSLVAEKHPPLLSRYLYLVFFLWYGLRYVVFLYKLR